jgi:hypothetical protein
VTGLTELDGKKIFGENGAAYSAPDHVITDKKQVIEIVVYT